MRIKSQPQCRSPCEFCYTSIFIPFRSVNVSLPSVPTTTFSTISRQSFSSNTSVVISLSCISLIGELDISPLVQFFDNKWQERNGTDRVFGFGSLKDNFCFCTSSVIVNLFKPVKCLTNEQRSASQVSIFPCKTQYFTKTQTRCQ